MNARELGLKIFMSARAGTFNNREEAVLAVNTVFEEITKALVAGEKVVITNFGRFDLSQTDERIGSNPKTGEPVVIPASRHVRFTACPGVKDALNGAPLPSKKKSR